MADGKDIIARTKHDPGTWRSRTKTTRGGHRRTGMNETSEALFLTSGYVYAAAEEAEEAFLPGGGKDRYIYSRYGNPTVAMFEERLRLIEGAEACRAASSGMAAVFASLACQLKAGDRIVSSRALFGSCHYIVSELLPRWGVESVLVNGTDLDEWRKALSKPTKAVFLETPSNPMLEIIDLREVSRLAHAAGARVVVDNVFATPLLQKPLQLGADIVVYSATKHIDGGGRCLGGAVLGSQKYIDDELQNFLKHTGPSLSPFNAWNLLKSLETMALRVKAQQRSAVEIATFLEQGGAQTRAVERVWYPTFDSHPQAALARTQMSGGGTMVVFSIAGGKKAAFRFLNALQIVDISNNLGDAKSLICHPATTTHQRIGPEERARLGIGDGVVRLSVGLEDVEDLKADIAHALAAV